MIFLSCVNVYQRVAIQFINHPTPPKFRLEAHDIFSPAPSQIHPACARRFGAEHRHLASLGGKPARCGERKPRTETKRDIFVERSFLEFKQVSFWDTYVFLGFSSCVCFFGLNSLDHVHSNTVINLNVDFFWKYAKTYRMIPEIMDQL